MEQNFKRTLTTVSCQKNLLVSGRANPDFSLESVRLVLTFSNIFNLLTVQSCFRCSDTGSDLDQTGGQIWLYSQRSLSRRHFFNLLLVKKGNFLSSVTKLLVADSLQTGIRTNAAMLNIKKNTLKIMPPCLKVLHLAMDCVSGICLLRVTARRNLFLQRTKSQS